MVSNPYAPPEDRPRTAEGTDPAATGGVPSGATGHDDAPAAVAGHPESQAHTQVGRPDPAASRVPTEAERRTSPAREPDPAGVLKAAEQSRVVGVLLLASVLVTALPVPWQLAAGLFALAALVLGVRGLVIAVRARARGSLPTFLGILVAMSAVWSLLVLASLSVLPMLRERQDCLAGALTITAEKQCQREFSQELERTFEAPARG